MNMIICYLEVVVKLKQTEFYNGSVGQATDISRSEKKKEKQERCDFESGFLRRRPRQDFRFYIILPVIKNASMIIIPTTTHDLSCYSYGR